MSSPQASFAAETPAVHGAAADALEDHGVVDHQAHDRRHALAALLQDLVQVGGLRRRLADVQTDRRDL